VTAPPPRPSLSITLPNFSAADPGSWEPLLDRARAADAAGVDRLVVVDHVAFGEDLDAYGKPELGGAAGGKQPTGPDGHWLEPLTLLAVVAGMTSRIRLGTGILIAALRRPIVLAKSTATLDVLSGGRLDLGVGVGWQREEYEAAGLPFEGRGRLLDHTLEVCQTIWREPVATYASDELRFERIHAMPKPLQPGGVPIWISGRINGRVVDRLVRFGAGWIPWGDDAKDPTAGVRRLRSAMDDAGRGDDPLQVAGSLPVVRDDAGEVDLSRTMEGVPALVEAGITDFRAPGAIAVEQLPDLVAAFRTATR
jgi:probable F420-dependent oxidoreductase